MALPPTNHVAGIALIIATGLCFVGLDTIGKSMTARFDPVQIVWGRFVFSLALLAVLLPRHGPGFLRSAMPGLQVVRGLLLLAVNVLFFVGVSAMQLIEATAIAQTTPLFLTALAAILLKEQVGPRRWAAVIAGFIGALIVIRPGLGIAQIAALLMLAMAVTNAFYLLATRRAATRDAPETSFIYPALMGAVASSIMVPFVWRPPDPVDWALMAAMGVLGGVGHFLLVQAYARAPASLLAPFPYLIIVWSGIFGYAAFGDVPDRWTLAGSALVVASGLYVWWRERRRAREGHS